MYILGNKSLDKKRLMSQINLYFIEKSIIEDIEKLTIDKYNKYKFHVEQETK